MNINFKKRNDKIEKIEVELTHKTDELERQAEIIKKFETAYNDSLALSVEKDE